MVNSEEIRGRITLEAENEEFTCEICTETTSKIKKFDNNNICKHWFCVDCIAKYAEIKIEDHRTKEIKCPGLNCKQRLDPLSCRPIIPSSLFSEWCDLLFENYLTDFEKTVCPNGNCTAVVINECRKKRVKKAQCPSCKQLFCFECKLPWHAGYPCQKRSNLRDPNDIAFKKLVKKMKWVRCPGCGHCVELKDGSCRRITCRCQTPFCYSCGRKLPCMCDQDEFSCLVVGVLLLFVILLIIIVMSNGF